MPNQCAGYGKAIRYMPWREGHRLAILGETEDRSAGMKELSGRSRMMVWLI
jgi:hypothetical protein